MDCCSFELNCFESPASNFFCNSVIGDSLPVSVQESVDVRSRSEESIYPIGNLFKFSIYFNADITRSQLRNSTGTI